MNINNEIRGHLILIQIFRLPFWLRILILFPVLILGLLLGFFVSILLDIWIFSKTGIDRTNGFNYIKGELEEDITETHRKIAVIKKELHTLRANPLNRFGDEN